MKKHREHKPMKASKVHKQRQSPQTTGEPAAAAERELAGRPYLRTSARIVVCERKDNEIQMYAHPGNYDEGQIALKRDENYVLIERSSGRSVMFFDTRSNTVILPYRAFDAN
jgi:hypothetical protein